MTSITVKKAPWYGGVNWLGLTKRLVQAAIPVIIVPGIAITLIVSQFGFSLESLTAMLFLGQIYFIWAQLEVSLRQTEVSMLEYEPRFRLEAESHRVEATGFGKVVGSTSHDLKLRNDGATAWNVMVSGDEAIAGVGTEARFFGSIPTGGTETLYPLSDRFQKSYARISISYWNQLGDLKSVEFSKSPDMSEFSFSGPSRPSGLLLRSLDDLITLPRWILIMWRFRRS